MSTQCSNLFNYRSFSLFPPFHTPLKPYSATLHTVFPFHGSLIQINRRSGNRNSYLPPPVAAQSSSDVVLVATTEHHDGSLIFQFGDASEVVKNDELVEEIESEVELECNVLKVLDRDQERGVVEKTIEGKYGSDTSRLTEVADKITNADIDSDNSERKTIVTSNLIDNHAESITRLPLISREQVLSSQFDAKTNESLEDDSLNPTISLFDNSPHIDKTADPKGTLSEIGGDDESDDQLVSVKPESIQASDTEVMDVKQPYAEVETDYVSKSDTENSMLPATIDISDVELMETANEDVNEDMEDMNINGVTLINTLAQNPDDVVLQTNNETEDTLVSVKLETIQYELMDITQTDELQNVELEEMNINEGAFRDEMPSNPLEFKPTMPVSDIEVQDSDGTLQVIDESEDPLESVLKLETMQASDIEVMDELVEVETKDTRENDANDSMCPETMHTSDIELTEDASGDIVEELQNMKFDEGTPLDGRFTIQVSIIEVEESKVQKSVDDVILQIKDVEHSLHQLQAQLVQDEGVNVNHNILEQCAEIDALGSSILLEQSSSELAEASEEAAILLATKAEVEREEIDLTGYILSSGAALLDHPFKELTGGDDAYFVASSKWLGVANGVSQWSLEGTDAGVYAQELMRTCKEIVLNTSTTLPLTNNPVQLLCRGVKETNMSGSSNILIANFNGQALHVANIGDTGFIIIRHGAVYKKSSPLLHEFHFALQLEDRDDPLQLAEEYVIELEEGDLVVSGTDGLFDNLYEQEIAMVVSKSLQAGMKPEEIAKALATRAQEVGRSAFVRSPFSDAAQAAGYTGYSGGKPDNVAVIVSLVEKTW